LVSTRLFISAALVFAIIYMYMFRSMFDLPTAFGHSGRIKSCLVFYLARANLAFSDSYSWQKTDKSEDEMPLTFWFDIAASGFGLWRWLHSS